MRTITVPAQVTTVEDRIAGNLTFPQLLLIMAGFGAMTLVYLFVAPRYHITLPKLIAITSVAILVGPLAIRIYGRLVAEWLILLARYAARPRRYVFTKNDRTLPDTPKLDEVRETNVVSVETQVPEIATPYEHVKLETLIEDPMLQVRFVAAKNGGLHVALTPTKQ